MKQYDHMDNQKEQSQSISEPAVQTKQASHSPLSKYLPLVVIAVVFAILASAGTYLASKQSNTKPQNLPQNTTPPSPTPSPAPNGVGETANWKTYTNTKYNFEFKYPSTFTTQEIILGTLDKPLFQLNLADPNSDINISGYATGIGLGAGEKIQTKQMVTIDNNSAVKYYLASSSDQVKLVQVSINNINSTGKDMTIFYRTKDDKIFTKGQLDTFDKILSTFKFTDQNQTLNTTNWKTYEWINHASKVFFKYPSNWVVVKEYYSTPVMQINKEQPENVGLFIRPQNDKTNYIHIDGSQNSCYPSENHTKCISIQGHNIFTDSKDFDILNVYDQILSTFKFTP